MARAPVPPRQVELVLDHDDFAERLSLEFAIILLPVVDKSMPQDRCREVANRLASLASRRARESQKLPLAQAPRPCSGCDAPVEVAGAPVLCGACAGSVRSAGSEG